jgi:hypothetical protein
MGISGHFVGILSKPRLALNTPQPVAIKSRGKRSMTKTPSALVVVSSFGSTAEAEIAKGILSEVGIDSMIRADNAGGMYPAISGAELLVRTEDVQQATEVLDNRVE